MAYELRPMSYIASAYPQCLSRPPHLNKTAASKPLHSPSASPTCPSPSHACQFSTELMSDTFLVYHINYTDALQYKSYCSAIYTHNHTPATPTNACYITISGHSTTLPRVNRLFYYLPSAIYIIHTSHTSPDNPQQTKQDIPPPISPLFVHYCILSGDARTLTTLILPSQH